jgi:hypothetical protein
MDIVERVSKYAQLTESEIDQKASGPVFARDYEMYPDPFPRDGSILLPPEDQDLRNVSQKIGELFPGRTSIAYSSAVLHMTIERCVSRDAKEDRWRELALAVNYLAEFDVEWMFIYPVENLVLEVGSLRLGPVQFQPTTEGDTFLRWRRRETRLTLRDTPLLWPTKSAPTFLDPTSECDTWASVRTRGDRLLAEERACRLVSEAIDIMRLFLARSETIGIRGSVNFGLGGQASGGHTDVGCRRSRVDSKSTRTRTFETIKKKTRYGPMATYKGVISSETLNRMHKSGLDALSRALETTKRSKLEERVFRALAWFSEGVTSPYDIDRFLKLVFAIDALLGGGPEGESATTDIAERAAFIAGRTVKARRLAKQEVVRFFRLRGDYAHGSRKAVPFGDLFAVELRCSQLIRAFVVHHMTRQSFRAFLEWVEDQKLSTADSQSRASPPSTPTV